MKTCLRSSVQWRNCNSINLTNRRKRINKIDLKCKIESRSTNKINFEHYFLSYDTKSWTNERQYTSENVHYIHLSLFCSIERKKHSLSPLDSQVIYFSRLLFLINRTINQTYENELKFFVILLSNHCYKNTRLNLLNLHWLFRQLMHQPNESYPILLISGHLTKVIAAVLTRLMVKFNFANELFRFLWRPKKKSPSCI